MLTVLIVWALYMLTYLVRFMPPEPPLWGVPGGIWLALNPPSIGKPKKLNEIQENEQ
jgi:hypothetical protein